MLQVPTSVELSDTDAGDTQAKVKIQVRYELPIKFKKRD